MIKKSLTLGLTAMLLALPNHASAQALHPNSEEYRGSKYTIDRVMAKLPETITCTNVTKERPINVRDFSTVTVSSQVFVFTLTNINLKFAGSYQMTTDTSPSVVIYSMNSGGSASNIIARIDPVTLEGSVLAISGNLPQPNTCQVGMKVTR